LWEENSITALETFLAVKTPKGALCDNIRPKMLKALTIEGVKWLTRVCKVAWFSGKAQKDWQTG